jgi:exosortase
LSQIAETKAEGALDEGAVAPAETSPPPPGRRLIATARRHGALIALGLGGTALAIPTLVENVQQNWSLDQSAEGPLVFAVGVWLIFRRWPAMRAAAAPPLGTAGRGLVLGLWVAATLVYVLGRAGGQYIAESYALYGFFLIGVYATFGARGLKAGGFPLVFLIFALPVPFFISHALTTHLRLGITQAVVKLFDTFGFEIEKDGLTIMIDQYQLAVEDACSGMNSLFSLSAMGLVYLYLRRPGRPIYLVLMLGPIIGFAIFSNFVRIAILVLITHLYGDAVAQSLLHETTGFITFAVALSGVFLLDALAAPWLPRLSPPAGRGRDDGTGERLAPLAAGL